MKIFHFFRKKTTVVFFLFFFSGCSYFQSSPWVYEEVYSSYPRCNYNRLIYSPKELTKGFDVEVTRGPGGTRLYLNLCLVPAVPEDEESRSLSFTYEIGGSPYTGKALVMKGGGRLLVDQNDSEQILSALIEGHPVTFSFGMYHQSISPEQFSNQYHQLRAF